MALNLSARGVPDWVGNVYTTLPNAHLRLSAFKLGFASSKMSCVAFRSVLLAFPNVSKSISQEKHSLVSEQCHRSFHYSQTGLHRRACPRGRLGPLSSSICLKAMAQVCHATNWSRHFGYGMCRMRFPLHVAIICEQHMLHWAVSPVP